MKPTVAFIDTNVLLDVLARRAPFYESSAQVWSLCEQGKIRAYISAISFNNIFYVLRKFSGHAAATETLGMLRDVFRCVALDDQIINQAIASAFADFEDAIQFHSALHVGARFIITRNATHFPPDDIPALTPAEFLAAHSNP